MLVFTKLNSICICLIQKLPQSMDIRTKCRAAFPTLHFGNNNAVTICTYLVTMMVKGFALNRRRFSLCIDRFLCVSENAILAFPLWSHDVGLFILADVRTRTLIYFRSGFVWANVFSWLVLCAAICIHV